MKTLTPKTRWTIAILAVVAGLTLSGAASLSHDLWNHVVRHGKAEEKEK